jgi:DNA-directed RNA polymerase subunit RPC12/RpoP
MPITREPVTAGNPSAFEKSCSYCGARFRVLATHADGTGHRAEYDCPECGKSYATEADDQPQVELLRARTDGKDDRYQETMF